MSNVDEVDASRIPYSDLAGRYIFRKPIKAFKIDNSRIYKMDVNHTVYRLSGKGGWVSDLDFFGEWSGLIGDPYEFIVLTKEQAIQKAKEWNINTEGLFD